MAELYVLPDGTGAPYGSMDLGFDPDVSGLANPGAIDSDGNRRTADVAVSPGQGIGEPYDHLAAVPICEGVYISTATTTTVSGARVLTTVVIGETAAGSITIYDALSATGTPIAVLKASIVEGTYTFNRQLAIGLTIVTAGASKLTANYIPVAS